MKVLILPDAALKTATIAQAIQKHFLNGYLILVRQLCQQPEAKKEAQDLQALVISRALTALSLLLLNLLIMLSWNRMIEGRYKKSLG